MSYGVLSGNEIAKAVKRHEEWSQLAHKGLQRSGIIDTSELSLPERLRFWWLSRQPRIHIEDFNPKPSDLGGRLNPNSYNLTLSPDLLVYDVPIIKPEVAHGLRTDWSEYALDMRMDNPTKKVTVPEEGMILKPGRLYLGRTEQYTESHNCRPCVCGRSSIGRLGIFIHVTAGYGDVGFKGTWTLEIVVVHPVKVYPHVPICQIDYATVSPNHRPYMSKKYAGQQEVTASRLFVDLQQQQAAEAVTTAAKMLVETS